MEKKSQLSHYLDPKSMFVGKVKSRDEAIELLSRLLKETGKISDEKALFQAVIEREKIVTTGIGMGVAIPHAKIKGYEQFHIAVGMAIEGVDWSALDGGKVRLIFLIAGPDDRQTEYLKILSMLTQTLKNEELRKQLLLAKSGEELHKLLKGI